MSQPVLLDGKSVSEAIRSDIASSVKNMVAQGQSKPTLATILVGDNPASETYVGMKVKACEKAGMGSLLLRMPKSTTTQELKAKIQELNDSPSVHGILLQHPVPEGINERECFDAISIQKDVDGVTSWSFGSLSMQKEAYFPCTPYGMVVLLQHYKVSVSGLHAVVVGRSPILGKPMAIMLSNLDATVTLCHSKTKNLPEILRSADLVVGAVGKPEFISSEWIKPGAILLDAGYNVGNVGDIDIRNSFQKSSFYTPVPGGVGPMTIAMLLLQTLYSAQGRFSPKISYQGNRVSLI